MMKQVPRLPRLPRLGVVISVTLVFCLFVLFLIFRSDLVPKSPPVTHQVNNFFISVDSSTHQTLNATDTPKQSDENRERKVGEESDICAGRYIYMHKLPSRFNDDLVKNCRRLNKWYNMCPFMDNSGFGPQLSESYDLKANVLTVKTGSWYSTNQFLLEVIFRERMKHYECLTEDSSRASAIYVPYYAGLDISPHLWGYNVTVRDESGIKLAEWLRKRPEWRKMYGRDHFFVSGRIGWDFRRKSDNDSDWGSKLMRLPEFTNMTMLGLEATVWTNDFAVPYPTYFHPKSLTEISRWQKRAKKARRRYLFSFVGGPRPETDGSIRGQIISQCLASHGKCKYINCNVSRKACDNPVRVMEVFQNSVFCLQPKGDSYTRRSIFDSILAGCIPVFFHPGSGYNQYKWYFPLDYTKYSIYVPEIDIQNGTVSLENVLRRVSKEKIQSMRNGVVKLIPKIIYSKPGSVEDDAFDIAVGRVLERVTIVKEMIDEGKDVQSEFSMSRDLGKLEWIVYT